MIFVRKHDPWLLLIGVLVFLLITSSPVFAESSGWVTEPPGSPTAESACPVQGQWMLLYWQNPPKTIEDASRTCPTADRYWAYEEGRWRGFTPSRPAASDAWLVPIGAAVFVQGGAAGSLVGAELVGKSVRAAGSLGRGEIELTVTEVRNAASLPSAFGTDQRARGTYVIIFFRAVNTGASAAELGIYSFYLMDGQERAFTVAPATAVQAGVVSTFGRAGLYSPVSVGRPQDLAVAFDLPSASKGLQLRAGRAAVATDLVVVESGP